MLRTSCLLLGVSRQGQQTYKEDHYNNMEALINLVHQGINEENPDARKIIDETIASYKKQPKFFAALQVFDF